ASNVNITNCNIGGFVKDIDSDPAVGTIIENNTLENATTCLLFYETNQSIIRNNQFWNCSKGINLTKSYLNNITNNYLEFVLRGIQLDPNSNFNYIDNNTINNFTVNFTSSTSTTFGILVDSDGNTISNNTIKNGFRENPRLYYGINLGYGEASGVSAEGNIVSSNTIYNMSVISNPAGAGIWIDRGGHNILEFNTIYDIDGRGIQIAWDNNTANNNTIYNCDYFGIDLQRYGGRDIVIFNNTIYNISGSGIRNYDDSIGFNISYNRIYNNTGYGIILGDEFATNEDGMLFHKVWNNEVFNNSEAGIWMFHGESVLLENNTVYDNSGSGIVLNTSDFSNVTNSSSYNNLIHGIMIVEVSGGGGGPTTGNIVENNRVTGNTGNGIDVENSGQEYIINNTAISNNNGIYLELSDNCDIINNTANNNNNNGILVNVSDGVWTVDNTVDGNVRDGVHTAAVLGNTIERNSAQNNFRGGIILEYSNYSFVYNNTATNNPNNNGMELFKSHYNVMADNIATLNGKDGIQLDEATFNNLTNNSASNNLGTGWMGPPPAGNGILLDDQAYFNILHLNTLVANKVGGITVTNSDDNTITNNTFTANSIGINITGASTRNTVYFNNFTNSVAVHANADAVGNSFNTTNGVKAAGFTAEGNAWSDIALWQIYDRNADGFGDIGAEYPYGLQVDGITIYGNVVGNVTDWGPMDANATPNPAVQLVGLNSSYYTNFTEENLNCYATIIDPYNTTVTAFYKWFNRSIEVPSLAGSTAIPNGTFSLVSSLSPSATHIGDNWTCEVTPSNGFKNGAPVNSSNQTIRGCGNLDRSLTLIENRHQNGSCFNLTADDIVLDCSNRLLNGMNSTGSVGIAALYLDNVTIKNCDVYNFTYGIQFNYTNSSFILSNILHNASSGDGAYLYYSFYNNLSNNKGAGKRVQIGPGIFSWRGRALIALENSNYNILVNNTHNPGATFTTGRYNYCLLLTNSNYNNLSNNTGRSANMNAFNLTSSSFNRLFYNYASNSGVAGFHLFGGSSNNTLINNSGDNNGLDSFRLETSHNNIIQDNSMQDDGLYGVHIILSNNNLVLDNTVFQENEGIYLNRSNFTLVRNNVGNNNYDYDYYLLYGFYNTIINNTALQSTSAGYFLDHSMYNNITNNTVVASWNHGLQIADKSHNNLFTNNRVTGSIWYNGFDIYDSFNNTFLNNSLASATSWNGYELGNASGTVISNGTIDPCGRDAFYLINSSNVDITDCTARNAGRKGIFLIDSDGVDIVRTTSTSNSAEDLNISLSENITFVDSFAQSYRFSQAGVAFENTTHGKINFTALLNQARTNLMQDIAFSNNHIFVDSANAPGLNVSADLTFYSVVLTDPYPFYDLEDDGSFTFCPTTICTEQSYIGTTYKYNVSHFTNYTSNETLNPILTIVKNDNVAFAYNGSYLNYTILYLNSGNGSAYNVTVIETYDANVTYYSAVPAPSDPTTNNTWNLGTIAPNSSGGINVTVFVHSNLTNNSAITNIVNITGSNFTGPVSGPTQTSSEFTPILLTPPEYVPPPPPAAPIGAGGGGGGGGSRSGYYSYEKAPVVEEIPTPPTKIPTKAKPVNVTVEEKPEIVEALPVVEEPVPEIIEEQREFNFKFLWWLIPLLLLLILLLILYEVRLHQLKEKVTTRQLASSFIRKRFPESLAKPARPSKPAKPVEPKKIKIKPIKKVIKAKPKLSTKELAATFMAKYGKAKETIIKPRKAKPMKVKIKKVKPVKVKKIKIKPIKKAKPAKIKKVKPKKPKLGLLKRVKMRKFAKQGKNLGKLETEMKDLGKEIDQLLKKKI
ncbi:right-handed parallel beta-helix repeat-containing protein, partial [Candidatus Woesearchaeota archaeon]|nr:right-handed parallel beta-helix repeat-containing protein [Candidatus Woesearchaeota archaeon]